MIPQETVNRILDSAQIVDVVGDFVTLKKRGANHIACCPFHNEKTPSFSVSASKGIYKCFGCFSPCALIDGGDRGARNAHPLGALFLRQSFSVEKPDRLKLIQAHYDRLFVVDFLW